MDIGFPFVLVQDANYSDVGAFVQMTLGDFGRFLKAGDLDPAGLFFG